MPGTSDRFSRVAEAVAPGDPGDDDDSTCVAVWKLCAALPPARPEMEWSRPGAGFVGMQFGTRIAVGHSDGIIIVPRCFRATPIGPSTGQLLAGDCRVRVFH